MIPTLSYDQLHLLGPAIIAHGTRNTVAMIIANSKAQIGICKGEVLTIATIDNQLGTDGFEIVADLPRRN
jgi:hypothetical protein